MKRREFLKKSAPAFMAATMTPTKALARRRRRRGGGGHDVPEIDVLEGTVAVGLIGAVMLLIRERFKAKKSDAV